MRNLKKYGAALVAASMITTMAGCGGTGTSSNGSGSNELTIWVMGDAQAKFEKLVKPFEKETGIKVHAVGIPWANVQQKITTAVASDKGPDILQIGLSNLRSVADTGKLLPLDSDTLSKYPNLDSSNFLDAVAGEATAIKGQVVSIPWVADTRILFSRTDILEEEGLSVPTTWDEVRSNAKKLAARGDGQYGYQIPQWDTALPVIMTWDEGGDIVNDKGNIDFTSDAFSKAVDLYTGFYADKSVPTSADFDQVQGFTSGVTPMFVSGPYMAASISDAAPELEGKWEISVLPSAEDNTSLFAGSNLSIWKSSKHQEQALKLLDYLSQPDVQVDWYFNGEGSLPTVKKAYDSDKLKDEKVVQVCAEQLQNAKLLPFDPNWESKTSQSLINALNSIVLQGADRDTAMKTLQDETSGASIN